MGFSPHMRDTCKIGTEAAPVAPAPRGAISWGSAIRCRVSRGGTREVKDGSQVALVDAQIRVASGTSVTSASRVQLTHRNGAALSSVIYYRVVGEPRLDTERRGAEQIVLNCELITGESMS